MFPRVRPPRCLLGPTARDWRTNTLNFDEIARRVSLGELSNLNFRCGEGSADPPKEFNFLAILALYLSNLMFSASVYRKQDWILVLTQFKKVATRFDLPFLVSQDRGSRVRVSVPSPSALPKQTQDLLKVAILLCTRNGQNYLVDQLESFAAQTHSNWEVCASDDDSQDSTRTIFESFLVKWGSDRLTVHSGPAEGFVANFLALTCKASIEADFFAYSDQDDVWEPEKLERAVSWLQTVPSHVPALYCSRTRLVDADNNEIGLSPLFSKPPSFANALMQNIGGGNTMVFNNAARALLSGAGEDIPIATHDWWAYMVITGCGGQVFYDSTPTLRYRQHGSNLVGMNATWPARFKRIRMLFQGRFRSWNDGNIVALRKLEFLTPKNRATLEQFAEARNMSLVSRLIHLKRSGIYRQTLLGNLGLVAASIFRKL